MKRFLVALAIGGTVLGAVTAFAASLGGVTTRTVGAGSAVVASCDTDGIHVEPNEGYSETAGYWEIRGVHLSGVADACDGRTVNITLTRGNQMIGFGGGQVQTSQTAVAPGQFFQALPIGGPVVKAEDLTNIHVVIS